MKKNIFNFLIVLLALCCLFVGCDNPAAPNSGNNGKDDINGGNEEVVKDWWLGTWKSQVYETTLPTNNEEIKFYYLIEINDYNSEGEETFIYSIINNDTNIIYKDDATVSTNGNTGEGSWAFIYDDEDINDENNADSIHFLKNNNEKLFEGGLSIDYDKQQLFYYNWSTKQREYFTKIK